MTLNAICPECKYWPCKCPRGERRRNAAGAGPKMTWETYDRLEKKMERIEEETIDRCAEVADEFFEATPWASKISARIRAMKDKP